MKRKAIIFTILNAGIINLFWTFGVIFGSSIGAKTPDFFNNVIEPAFIKLFVISFFTGLILSLFGSVALMFDKSWAKKVLLSGVWISIVHPSLYVVFILLLWMFGKGNILDLFTIFVSGAVSRVNFIIGNLIIKGFKQQ